MGKEASETQARVVAVGAFRLAIDGLEDAVVVVAGGAGVVIAPVRVSSVDGTIVEDRVAASCGTGDEAVAVVPVVRPTFDWSLYHFGM